MGKSAQLALPSLPILPDVTQGRASGVCIPRDRDVYPPLAIIIAVGYADVVGGSLLPIVQRTGRQV